MSLTFMYHGDIGTTAVTVVPAALDALTSQGLFVSPNTNSIGTIIQGQPYHVNAKNDRFHFKSPLFYFSRLKLLSIPCTIEALSHS